MIEAGVNVINMSYWGIPGTDNWAYWAPMQTSTASHNELFDVALGTKLLICPYIESFAQTDNYAGFSFMDDFPGSVSNPAPVLISLIEDLIERYILHPKKDQWPSKWAQVYDQHGQKRYLISIIHVASNQSSITDRVFANGFDRVAQVILASTGVAVGFALDILPPNSYAPGNFKATPTSTGTWLSQQSSLITIQCFIPEIWTGMSNENDLITWKRDYHTSWIQTGIPFIHDLSSGYDAHIVFPGSPHYGNNQTWRDAQFQAIKDFESESFTFNTWNGYTEGLAGIPTLQYGEDTYQWICEIYQGICGSSTDVTEEMHNISLKLCPNPVSSVMQIHAEELIQMITVYGADGRPVWKSGTNAGNTLWIDLTEIQNGWYMLEAWVKGKRHLYKFVKLTNQ